jgi:hypothetical protein
VGKCESRALCAICKLGGKVWFGTLGPLRDFYVALLDKGMEPELARLTLARKIAAIALTLWKKGGTFRR